ncbi:hypothetical protein MMAN_00670 [Mycobacterium mantenii]|uniref:Uncharacterized protein n=1 Tax=Mycobacterium mantenii TaxID=560555 RepID=A0ABN6A2L7_MYCNT|nr:hypothetical protein MMAN_00670 [Mycobacterium mantenii]
MAAVHQRVAPRALVDLAVRTLCQVTLGVAGDLSHVRVVGLGELSPPFGLWHARDTGTLIVNLGIQVIHQLNG